MKFLIAMFLIAGCELSRPISLEVGDCVLGERMAVWKLKNMDREQYLFVTYPITEGAPTIILEDVSALKKVKCPE